MKLGNILYFIILIGVFISALWIIIYFQSGGPCMDKCINQSVPCDHDDNNCHGGDHYCYDMCVGGGITIM